MNHLLRKKYEKEELSIQHKIEIEDAEALIKYYDHDEDKVLDFAEFAKCQNSNGKVQNSDGKGSL